jgi:hypothetical protein
MDTVAIMSDVLAGGGLVALASGSYWRGRIEAIPLFWLLEGGALATGLNAVSEPAGVVGTSVAGASLASSAASLGLFSLTTPRATAKRQKRRRRRGKQIPAEVPMATPGIELDHRSREGAENRFGDLTPNQIARVRKLVAERSRGAEGEHSDCSLRLLGGVPNEASSGDTGGFKRWFRFFDYGAHVIPTDDVLVLAAWGYAGSFRGVDSFRARVDFAGVIDLSCRKRAEKCVLRRSDRGDAAGADKAIQIAFVVTEKAKSDTSLELAVVVDFSSKGKGGGVGLTAFGFGGNVPGVNTDASQMSAMGSYEWECDQEATGTRSRATAMLEGLGLKQLAR